MPRRLSRFDVKGIRDELDSLETIEEDRLRGYLRDVYEYVFDEAFAADVHYASCVFQDLAKRAKVVGLRWSVDVGKVANFIEGELIKEHDGLYELDNLSPNLQTRLKSRCQVALRCRYAKDCDVLGPPVISNHLLQDGDALVEYLLRTVLLQSHCPPDFVRQVVLPLLPLVHNSLLWLMVQIMRRPLASQERLEEQKGRLLINRLLDLLRLPVADLGAESIPPLTVHHSLLKSKWQDVVDACSGNRSCRMIGKALWQHVDPATLRSLLADLAPMTHARHSNSQWPLNVVQFAKGVVSSLYSSSPVRHGNTAASALSDASMRQDTTKADFQKDDDCALLKASLFELLTNALQDVQSVGFRPGSNNLHALESYTASGSALRTLLACLSGTELHFYVGELWRMIQDNCAATQNEPMRLYCGLFMLTQTMRFLNLSVVQGLLQDLLSGGLLDPNDPIKTSLACQCLFASVVLSVEMDIDVYRGLLDEFCVFHAKVVHERQHQAQGDGESNNGRRDEDSHLHAVLDLLHIGARKLRAERRHQVASHLKALLVDDRSYEHVSFVGSLALLNGLLPLAFTTSDVQVMASLVRDQLQYHVQHRKLWLSHRCRYWLGVLEGAVDSFLVTSEAFGQYIAALRSLLYDPLLPTVHSADFPVCVIKALGRLLKNVSHRLTYPEAHVHTRLGDSGDDLRFVKWFDPSIRVEYRPRLLDHLRPLWVDFVEHIARISEGLDAKLAHRWHVRRAVVKCHKLLGLPLHPSSSEGADESTSSEIQTIQIKIFKSAFLYWHADVGKVQMHERFLVNSFWMTYKLYNRDLHVPLDLARRLLECQRQKLAIHQHIQGLEFAALLSVLKVVCASPFQSVRDQAVSVISRVVDVNVGFGSPTLTHIVDSVDWSSEANLTGTLQLLCLVVPYLYSPDDAGQAALAGAVPAFLVKMSRRLLSEDAKEWDDRPALEHFVHWALTTYGEQAHLTHLFDNGDRNNEQDQLTPLHRFCLLRPWLSAPQLQATTALAKRIGDLLQEPFSYHHTLLSYVLSGQIDGHLPSLLNATSFYAFCTTYASNGRREGDERFSSIQALAFEQLSPIEFDTEEKGAWALQNRAQQIATLELCVGQYRRTGDTSCLALFLEAALALGGQAVRDSKRAIVMLAERQPAAVASYVVTQLSVSASTTSHLSVLLDLLTALASHYPAVLKASSLDLKDSVQLKSEILRESNSLRQSYCRFLVATEGFQASLDQFGDVKMRLQLLETGLTVGVPVDLHLLDLKAIGFLLHAACTLGSLHCPDSLPTLPSASSSKVTDSDCVIDVAMQRAARQILLTAASQPCQDAKSFFSMFAKFVVSDDSPTKNQPPRMITERVLALECMRRIYQRNFFALDIQLLVQDPKKMHLMLGESALQPEALRLLKLYWWHHFPFADYDPTVCESNFWTLLCLVDAASYRLPAWLPRVLSSLCSIEDTNRLSKKQLELRQRTLRDFVDIHRNDPAPLANVLEASVYDLLMDTVQDSRHSGHDYFS